MNGCLALIDNPDLDVDALMEYIPGPDFPTAAFINGRDGIVEAYRTGRGRIYLRARHVFEEDERNGKVSIVFTEIPYMVNKARLIEKIAELVKEKKIEGITELRDESDKDGPCRCARLLQTCDGHADKYGHGQCGRLQQCRHDH